jgi:hypothetical protein
MCIVAFNTGNLSYLEGWYGVMLVDLLLLLAKIDEI